MTLSNQDRWYDLVRRLDRGPDFRRLDSEEAEAEYEDATPLAPRPRLVPGVEGKDSTQGAKTAALQTIFLLERARSNDNRAWREIYRRYRSMLVVKIQMRMRRFRGRRFQAEQMLLDAFAKVWTNIRAFEYRGEGSFRRWLTTVVLNEFQNLVKAEQHVQSSPMEFAEGELHRAEEVQLLSEQQAGILEEMGTLLEEEQEVISMKVFEGMSFEAIAEVLDCSRESARLTYARALGHLRKRFLP